MGTDEYETNRSTEQKMMDRIAAKQRTRPKTDSQGRVIGKQVWHDYDDTGRLIGPSKVQPDDDPDAA